MSSPPEQPPILYRRSTILFVIFFGVGVLTIPLIWQSPAFGRKEKMFWSVVAAAYTTLMVVLIIVFAVMMYELTVGRMGEIY